MSGPQPISDETRVKVRGDVVWREVDGQIVLLDLEGETYFTVSGSGVPLWLPLAEGTTASALAAVLVERYGIDRAVAAEDARAFLTSLEDEGLLAVD